MVVRFDRIDGLFNARGTIGSLGLGFRRKDFSILVNASNSNGSAALGVVGHLIRRSDNIVHFTKRRVHSLPILRLHHQVNCTVRSVNLFPR